MAIGRSGMTKELFGDRTKKMSHGGDVVPDMKKGGKVPSNFMKFIAKKAASPKKMK